MNTYYNQTPQPVPQKKGFQPFYLLPLLYIVTAYLLPVSIFAGWKEDVFLGIGALFLVSGMLNIIFSAVCCKPENRMVLLGALLLTRYALIPFFIIGLFLALATLLVSLIPVPFMFMVGPAFALLEIGFFWLVLAFGAPYAIAYLNLSTKAGIRPSGICVLHGILQFFFVTDVIDAMVLSFRERKWRGLTITIIVLLALCIFIALAL